MQGRLRKHPAGSRQYIGFNLDIDIAAAVDAVACREGMNRSEAVAYLLAKALENEDW